MLLIVHTSRAIHTGSMALAGKPAVGVCEATTVRELAAMLKTEKLAPKTQPQPRRQTVNPKWHLVTGIGD
jgi:hypothetical protein